MKPTLYRRIREILEAARTGVARSVNTTQVVANWLIGREIVEEEQRGSIRAGYGKRLVADLSRRITTDFGQGYSITNLEHFRDFYLTYPQLLPQRIAHAVRGESGVGKIPHALRGEFEIRNIPHALRALSAGTISDALRRKSEKSYSVRGQSKTAEKISNAAPSELAISHTVRDQSWQPGQLHTDISWTHYRTLLRVEKPEARSFYEIEATQNNWSARELERQINSLLYERLALSRDKKGLAEVMSRFNS